MIARSRAGRFVLDQQCLRGLTTRSSQAVRDGAWKSILPDESLSTSQTQNARARPPLSLPSDVGMGLAAKQWRNLPGLRLELRAPSGFCWLRNRAKRSGAARAWNP